MAELSEGQMFAGWRIERELARGGMGVLYLARHPRLPRTDVIKILPSWLTANQRFRERFLREATRMSTLSHPHLMPIHDSGESEDGTLYLVMPYISGGDLRHLLRERGPLPPARACRIVVQLAAALDAAHRVGVVHRDVKPENVLLAAVEPDDEDHALLTDFGISREDMGSNTLTATGELLLTPAYAAPEQVLGRTVDSAVDEYALACILFELLTGRPPYVNDVQVAMLMAHVQEPVPRVAQELGLPPAIDGVLAKAMAKDPAQRYDSCRSLAQAAAAALDLSVSTPRPAVDIRETGYSPPPPARQSPTGPPAARAPQGSPAPQRPPTGPRPQGPAYPNQGRGQAAPPPWVAQRPAPPRDYGAPPPPQRDGSTSGFTPGFGPTPPQPKRRRRWLVPTIIAAVALIAAAVIVVATAGGGKKANTNAGTNTSAAYSALLARLPASIRNSCQNSTATLSSAEQPHLAVRATCVATTGGHNLGINYRTVEGDTNTIANFRRSVLGLGGKNHPPGDCMAFTGPMIGLRGYAGDISSGTVQGSVWCDNDGTLWYLQTSPGSGNLPILTEVKTSLGNAQALAEQRFADLASVAPSP
jgi:serine/threonine-protein kinase